MDKYLCIMESSSNDRVEYKEAEDRFVGLLTQFEYMYDIPKQMIEEYSSRYDKIGV